MNAPHPLAAVAVRAANLDDPGECARIDGFVAAHPDATLFHRPQWSRAVERGCRQRAHYLLAERGGALVGCLPLTEIRSALFGNALVSAGFATGGGILAEGEAAAAALAEAAWALAARQDCAGVELRGGPIPAGWHASTGTYSAFSRPLPAQTEALLASLPRRQRAEVRRANEYGLEVTIGRDAAHLAAHYRVYAESVRNLGTPVFPKSLFDAMIEGFGDDAEILLVAKDGRPLATMLTFYFRGLSQPVWGGGTFEARVRSANDLAYFAVMQRGIARGCDRADFGRSKLGTGPYQRKRIWGFEERTLTYGIRTVDGAAPRAVNPLDAKYRLKVAAWQKLPLWLANRLGPPIARGLG